jgi:hypothetical protein
MGMAQASVSGSPMPYLCYMALCGPLHTELESVVFFWDDLQGFDQFTSYGGVVFGYNETVVRVWAPSLDTTTTASSSSACGGSVISILDGWTGSSGTVLAVSNAIVKVRSCLITGMRLPEPVVGVGFQCIQALIDIARTV